MEETREQVRVGLIGEGISASRTPAMHEAEGAAQGIDYSYCLRDTAERPDADLAAILEEVEGEGFTGVNVTHPFKQRVLELVSEWGPEVESVGASNTIIFEAGKRRAQNTDYLGFLHAFNEEMVGQRKDVVLLAGAGGAGRAVGLALAEAGVVEIHVLDSRAEAAARLVTDIETQFPSVRAVAADPARLGGLPLDGIVNATPVGMAAHPGMAVERKLLEPGPWVADIVYFPLETELLRAARALGCLTMSGRGMAVMQAVKAFELFTGRPASKARMGEVFDRFDARGADL